MSGRQAKASRRGLRRVVGASAVSVIDQQSDALRALVPAVNRHDLSLAEAWKQIEALRVDLGKVLDAEQSRASMTRWQRFCWLMGL